MDTLVDAALCALNPDQWGVQWIAAVVLALVTAMGIEWRRARRP